VYLRWVKIDTCVLKIGKIDTCALKIGNYRYVYT